jgi:hypothetical protein
MTDESVDVKRHITEIRGDRSRRARLLISPVLADGFLPLL